MWFRVYPLRPTLRIRVRITHPPWVATDRLYSARQRRRHWGLAGKKCLPLLHTLMKLMLPGSVDGAWVRSDRSGPGASSIRLRVKGGGIMLAGTGKGTVTGTQLDLTALDTHDFCLLQFLIRLNYSVRLSAHQPINLMGFSFSFTAYTVGSLDIYVFLGQSKVTLYILIKNLPCA